MVIIVKENILKPNILKNEHKKIKEMHWTLNRWLFILSFEHYFSKNENNIIWQKHIAELCQKAVY